MSGFEATIIVGLTIVEITLPILAGILGGRLVFDYLAAAGRGWVNW